MLWKGIPEGWGSGGQGPVSQGSVLGSGNGIQEVGVSRSEMVGVGMAVEKLSEIKGVIEGFGGDEEEFTLELTNC